MIKKKEQKLNKSYPEIISIFVSIFISGVLISESFSNELYIIWVGIALASLILSFFISTAKSKTICLFISALSVSMFYGAIRFSPQINMSDLLVLDNSEGQIYGCYTGESKIQNRNKIIYKFKNIDYTTDDQTIEIPIKIDCQTTLNRERLYPEQYYLMTGKLKILSLDKPPLFEIASFTSTEQKLPSVSTTAKQFQEKIKHGLNSVLKKEHAAIVIGFILGDTSNIRDKNIFIETGISHVLAISGQHIMIIIFLLASIFHWFKIPPISRTVMISAILAFYALATTGSPSIWRALIMYLSISTIMLLESSSSPIRPISIAAFIMLLYEPSLLKNSAFILSFTAVLSIIFLRQPIEFLFSKLHLPDSLKRYFAVTFAANIGIMPMIAYLFGTVSLSSLFVNPLILWTFAFIIPISFFIAILSIFSIPTAVFLSSGLSVLLDALINFLNYVKNIPGLYFYVGNISNIAILFIYSLMLLSISIFNRWQVNKYEESLKKSEISAIPIAKLPEEKNVKIHIDKNSKATPTFLGNSKPLKTTLKTVSNKNSNPLKNEEIVKAIDEMLIGLKRLRINNNKEIEQIIPVNNLCVESQNLYYKLLSMGKYLYSKEPARLLQAHIFMLAIIGYELLNRFNQSIQFSIPEEVYNINLQIKDKYLAIAIIADSIMNSDISNELQDSNLNDIINIGKNYFSKAEKLLQQILNDKSFNESIDQHLELRIDLIKWCWQLIQYDNILKLKRKKNLR